MQLPDQSIYRGYAAAVHKQGRPPRREPHGPGHTEGAPPEPGAAVATIRLPCHVREGFHEFVAARALD